MENGWYHVFHRGLNRMAIFCEDRDKERFVELLDMAHKTYRMKIHAYSILDNHYHLVVQTPEGNISAAMQWVNMSYAAWYNAKRNRSGTVFGGRFRSVPVEDGEWAYELSLYVHLNVVRTDLLGFSARERRASRQGLGREPTKEQLRERQRLLREYRWSSYREYAGYERAADWVETVELLDRTRGTGEERQKLYREEVQELARSGGEEGKLERLRDKVAIGSEGFVRRVKKLGAKLLARETAGKRVVRRRVEFTEVVEAVEKAKGEKLGQFRDKRGDCGRDLLLATARRHCGLSLIDLGLRVGGLDYAAVSIAIKRFEQAVKSRRDLRNIQNAVETMLNVET